MHCEVRTIVAVDANQALEGARSLWPRADSWEVSLENFLCKNACTWNVRAMFKTVRCEAIVAVTSDLLGRALDLPVDVKIVAAKTGIFDREIDLLLTGPGLPAQFITPPGEGPRRAKPKLTRVEATTKWEWA